MSIKFSKCLEKLLNIEGGYVNNPDDPGGETNHGITKRTAMSYGYEGDMKTIPMNVVEDIYFKNYWDSKFDILGVALAYNLFDASVNCGRSRAWKWYDESVYLSHSDHETICKFNALRLQYLTNLPTWKTFGKGWTRRIAHNLTL